MRPDDVTERLVEKCGVDGGGECVQQAPWFHGIEPWPIGDHVHAMTGEKGARGQGNQNRYATGATREVQCQTKKDGGEHHQGCC